jgi:hypothetical protein
VRPGLWRQHDILFDQVDLGVEFVDSDPVAQVAVQAIGLLDQHDEAPLVLAGEGDHAAEGAAAGLLGGLDVNEFVGDPEAPGRSIRSQQIELRRDREALALLILRGDAGVQDGSGGHGI